MRNTVAIQSRREYTPEGGKLGVYFNGVIMGVDGLMEFSTYDPKIQPYIVIGKNVDIEWEESPGKPYQGNPTTKRKVTQLYIDGKPIVDSKAFAGKPFGGGYKDSPETRASIEAQTAVNDVVSLLVAKVITIDHSLAQKAIAWLDSKLPSVVAKQPEANPALKEPATPEQLMPDFVSGQMIKNLMRYSGAEDEEDLRVKAEAFLGAKLPGMGAMKSVDAARWAKELLKVKK